MMKRHAARRAGCAPAPGLLLAALLASRGAWAQTTASPAMAIESVTVTGTRVPSASPAGASAPSASPVIGVTGNDLQTSGYTHVEDYLNQLPQVFGDQSTSLNNGASGIATVNLRGLGPQRTLVLIDSKRLVPGDPTTGSIAPDLNFIPDALVNRIEILTGGASAVYGSDAIAGVVNFLMKRDFQGVQLDLSGGFYSHTNTQTGIQALVAAQGDAQAPPDVTDGFRGQATLTAGINSPDGKGNITGYVGTRSDSAVLQASRDYSACALFTSGTALACSGSSRSTALGRFIVINPATFKTVANLTLDPTGPGNTVRTFVTARDAYNFAPLQYFVRPDKRYVAGAFAHYQLLPNVELYGDVMGMRDTSFTQLAPSGLFSNFNFSIRCDSPLFSAAEVTAFCTNAGLPAAGTASIAVGHRDVEGLGRQNHLVHNDYRIVAGARGDLDEWQYDVFVQHAAVNISQTDIHDVSLARAADALNAVTNAAGQIVCASGNTGCAPYNPFKIGGVTQSALSYLDVRAHATGGTNETVVGVNITGKLDRYGVKSPLADNGVGVAVGAEYRSDGLYYAPDAEFATGDLASGASANPPVNGATDVKELYAELRAPLVQNGGALLQDLSASLGYRYSLYSGAGSAHTYKIGLDWTPSPEVFFRAGFNHAVRAPNVVELFTPQTENFAGLQTDPCAGANPAAVNPFATAANCARTGVSAAQYGQIVAAPDDYNVLNGGNPNLAPETADTKTLGVVITPTALDGFTLALDYFDIRLSGGINTILPDYSIEQCLETGSPFFCSLVHRAPGTGSLWITSAGYVSNLLQNTGSRGTKGIDADLNYHVDLSRLGGHDLGGLAVRLVGTYTFGLSTVTQVGAAPYDCAGYFGGNTCGDPAPKWRHNLKATWISPWDVDIGLSWRFIGATDISNASTNPAMAASFIQQDLHLGARSYFDANVDWRIDETWEIRAGVRNLFDNDPPIVGTDAGAGVAANANTYPALFDALGRSFSISLTTRL